MAATAKDNVELVEGLYDAFNRGDIDTVLAGMADDVTWIEPAGDPVFGGTYHGPAAVAENVFLTANEEYEDFVVTPDRLIDGGDTVVVEGHFTGSMQSGADFEVPFVHVADVADGKLARFANYTDTATFQQKRDASA